MKEAAWGGNLELVQWMRGDGCPWDYGTCYNAVSGARARVRSGRERTSDAMQW